MCRFVFYHGPPLTLDTLITRPTHSLVHQSYDAGERPEPLNGDGFGVAWYVPRLSEEPAIFRSVSPAWSNHCLRDLCRVTESGCVLAHVRAASPGLPVVETNCHPFPAEGLAFMHNGHVSNFRAIKRPLITELSDQAYRAILGSTDSEHVFALFRDELRAEDERSLEAMGRAMERSLKRLVALSHAAEKGAAITLNLVASDGKNAVVTRFSAGDVRPPSLYLHEGRRYLLEDGLCRMEAGEGRGAVLVSSERLSQEDGWDRVAENHLLLIDGSGTVLSRPIQMA